MPKAATDLPVLFFPTGADWEAWLVINHEISQGAWLKFGKKSAEIKTLSRQEAIDGALCHGWIDGQADKFDEHYWLVRFTRRKSTSPWSDINRKRANELIDQNRIKPAGLLEIERAKSDGRWDKAYLPQSRATVPDDLQAALDANAEATKMFQLLTSVNRYAIIYRVNDAKKPETRAQRIEKFVAMLARGETIHPQKTKPAG
ncbi:YdeI family protein [Phyllobacterium sp. TAF24]|uniref:YdeI/OmpD-associated family protein n=1 Tax=Phyllobacterium sp. TAF24 TaxID=3233068 RepID=UPI003F990E67